MDLSPETDLWLPLVVDYTSCGTKLMRFKLVRFRAPGLRQWNVQSPLRKK